MSGENALTKDEVLFQLWQEYVHDKEYMSGAVNGIRRDHSIVKRREEGGLLMLYRKYVKKAALQGRVSPAEMINEIKDMHNLLFKYVFKERGKYRKEERRIGDYFDETLKLPFPNEIPAKMAEFAGWLFRMTAFPDKYLDKCYLLAEVHLRLVMIHPFLDGNGRIARAVADKYAIMMGLPPVYDAYPRVDKHQQKKYHDAIYQSRKNNNLEPLALWVKSYVDRIIETLA